MKRKSDIAKYSSPKNPNNPLSYLENVRRQGKRNLTTVQVNQNNINHSKNKNDLNKFSKSMNVVNSLINSLLDDISPNIEKIQRKRTLSSMVNLSWQMQQDIIQLQDPEVDQNEISFKPQQQPLKNSTDPISGFNKQNFIHRQASLSMMTKKMKQVTKQQQQHQESLLNYNPSTAQRKLPPLMKHLNDQKAQKKIFVQLRDQNTITQDGKKSISMNPALEQIFRERLMKEIDHRKFKQRIQLQMSKHAQSKLENSNGKKSKSNHKENSVPLIKEDLNFDYNGEKIYISNYGKAKSNLKILKALYKFNKQRPEDLLKATKLQKKVHERISFLPSRQSKLLMENNKSIQDFNGPNYSASLKQKVEFELRKTQAKFNQKDFNIKEKDQKLSLIDT